MGPVQLQDGAGATMAMGVGNPFERGLMLKNMPTLSPYLARNTQMEGWSGLPIK